MSSEWRAPLTFMPEDATFQYEAGSSGEELADRTIERSCPPAGDRYEVEQGGYRFAAEGDAVLATDNLFSCVGIAAYDPEQGVGFLSHADYRSVQEGTPVDRLYGELEDACLEVALVVGPEPMEAILDPVREALEAPPDGIEIESVETVYTGGDEGAGRVTFDHGAGRFCV